MYESWTDENGVLHVEAWSYWDWITPEFMAAIEAGDTERAKALAGLA